MEQIPTILGIIATKEIGVQYHQTGLQTSYTVKSSPNVHQCGLGVALYAKLRAEGNPPEKAATALSSMDLEQARLDLAHMHAETLKKQIPAEGPSTYNGSGGDEF